MAKIKLRPLDDRVVVKPQEAEETTAGSCCPTRLKKSRNAASGSGGSRQAAGQRQSRHAVRGRGRYRDLRKYGGSEVEVDGHEVKILRGDILAKILA